MMAQNQLKLSSHINKDGGPLVDQPRDAPLSSFPPQWRLRGPFKSTLGALTIACIHLHLYLDY